MGLPSGVMWSPVNIDVERPGGFAESPYQYECSYFSWGNVDGHNPTGPASFSPWNWGGINAQEPWYDGQVYGNTPGNTLTGDIPVDDEFDAARANIGTPWKIPTAGDFEELFENSIFINANGTEVDPSRADKRVTVNDTVGIFLQSKINGARLFLPCSGFGYRAYRDYVGRYGYYWSSSYVGSNNAIGAVFDASHVYPALNNSRYYGFPIRPVMTV